MTIAKKKTAFRPTPTQVSEPVFSPEGGTFSGKSVSVTITCATSGASIRYKIGSTPPTSTSGTLIANGGSVSISLSGNGTILQAIAYKSGLANSPVHGDIYYAQGSQQQAVGGDEMTLAMPPSRSETFVYDQLGNRKGANTLDARGSVTFARRDTGLNQYVSWTPPMAATNYDANGVLTSEGWMTGTYNALNQPVTISSASASVSFGYDPLGRCVKRASGTTTYLYYDGWDLIQEGSSATSVDRIYVHGNRVDEIVADQASGVWSYHHYDARGHCTLLTDASGNLVEQYSYDAFGKVYYYDGAGNTLTDTARGNRFLFTGREWLSTLKIYDFRNRHYLPELGRFIQPDPQEFAAGDYNLYRYCHNDPVNKSDPTGLLELSRGEAMLRYCDGQLSSDAFKEGIDRGNKAKLKALSERNSTLGVISKVGSGTSYPSMDPAKPNRFILGEPENEGYRKIYPKQLVNDKGEKLGGDQYSAQEKTRYITQRNVNSENTDKSVPRPLRSGIFTDAVGLKGPPGKDINSTDIREQRIEVFFYGKIIPVSTVFRHEVYVSHGNVIINVTPTVP